MYFSKRFQSLTGQENFSVANGGMGSSSSDLDSLKAEILTEMRKEIQKMKQEIIDGEIFLLRPVSKSG